MIWLIARREVVDHLRSARFVALCALAVVLLPLSAYVNASDWRARRAFHDALRQAQLARLAAADSSREMSAGGVRGGGVSWGWRSGEVSTDEVLRAVRPPAPLSVLAAGSDASLPAYWQFGSEGVAPGPPLATAAGSGGGGADFVFVVQVVLGLLAILLGGDAVCGEAESGVLRAVLANPVPRAYVVAGKYVGGMITLLVPLALGAPLALLVLRARGVPVVDADGLPRAAAFTVVAVLYLSAMLALAIAVSTQTHRARTAFVVLLAGWVVLVLVVPRAAELVAAGVRPVQPEELARRARVAAAAAIEAERVDALVGVWRRVAGTDDIPDGPFPPALKRAYNDARAPVEAEMFRRKRAAFAALDDARERSEHGRRALVAAVSRVSPAATFAFAASDLAGTGERTRERWLSQVRAHQRALEAAAFDHVYGVELYDARAGRLRVTWGPDPTDPADMPPAYADLPRFAFVAESAGEAVRATIPDVAWLFACNALLLAAAVAGFVRYEVR